MKCHSTTLESLGVSAYATVYAQNRIKGGGGASSSWPLFDGQAVPLLPSPLDRVHAAASTLDLAAAPANKSTNTYFSAFSEEVSKGLKFSLSVWGYTLQRADDMRNVARVGG